MLNSRDINDLKPAIKMKCLALIEKCKQANIDIIITCTLRDDEAQNALYEIGRSQKGFILTNLRGGDSKHNHGLAFDFCVMNYGKCDWHNATAFKKVGELGESLGLKWAGRWRGKLREFAHFEV